MFSFLTRLDIGRGMLSAFWFIAALTLAEVASAQPQPKYPEAPAFAAVDTQKTKIINYLLGLSTDKTGLDLNGDSKVDVVDLYYYIKHRIPTVTSFAIASGAASTVTRTVTLNSTCLGNPQYYMASESSSFSGATWQAYSAAPTFTLSTGNGTKTVYFKVQDINTLVSPVVSDTITLNAPLPPPVVSSLKINNGASSTASRTVTLNNTCTGSPTYYMASESSTFADGYWIPYSTAPQFSITTTGNGTKTIWFKVKDGQNQISSPISDSIQLAEVITQQLLIVCSASESTVNPDERIHYTIVVANHGTQTLTNVKVGAATPANCSFINDQSFPITDNYGFSPGDQAYWSLGALAGGENRTIQVSVRTSMPSGSHPNGVNISLSANVNCDQGFGSVSNFVNTTIVNNPMLSLGLVADRSPVDPGATLTYTLVYANRSATATSPNAVISVPLPGGTTFVSASDGATPSGGVLSWSLGTLGPGQSGQKRFSVTVNPASNGTLIQTEAEIHDGATSQHAARASAASAVQNGAALQLAVTASGDHVRPDDRVTYSITATNRGTTDLTDVMVGALTPDHCNFISYHSFPITSNTDRSGFDSGLGPYWSLGTLPAGGSRTVQVSIGVNINAPLGLPLHFGAAVRSGAKDSSANAIGSTAFAARDAIVISAP